VKPSKILISGAGIGGLTAALALARDGHSVEIFEQAKTLGDIGAGVTLAPNAMRVFGHLGIAPAIEEAGVEPHRQRVQHWADGRQLLALERGASSRKAYGAAYIYIHRADLHQILQRSVAATGRVQVHLDAKTVTAAPHGDAIALCFADGTRVEGDIAVAACGIKSALRDLVLADQPVFSGHVAWRALVPVDGPELTDLAAYPGIHIGPGRMIARYPVRGGRLLNLVFFSRCNDWLEEGWTIPADPGELEAIFAEWCPQVHAMIAAIAPGNLHRWAIFARPPAEHWTAYDHLCLLGDAAHASTPFLGQGAAAAIEDGFVLARAVKASDTPKEALRRYQAARQDHCALIQHESNANADRMQGPESELFGLGKLINEETLGLFSYDVATIPV
jgi:salicylate hydroxylase